MAHQRSNDWRRGALVQQVADEAVAQHVRGEGVQAELLLPHVEQLLDLPGAADERSLAFGSGHHSLEHRHQRCCDGAVPVIRLAAHEQAPVGQVDVLVADPRDLGQAQAGAPRQLDHVGVVGVLGAHLGDGRVHLLGRDHLEAAGANARHLDPVHRVAAESARGHGEADDPAQRPEFLPHDRLQGDAFALAPVDVVADRGGVDLVKARRPVDHVAQLEVRAVVELPGALGRATVAQVGKQQVESVVEGQGRKAGAHALLVDGVAPFLGLVGRRERGAVDAATQHDDDGAVAAAVSPNPLGELLLPGHEGQKGALQGATVSMETRKTMRAQDLKESGGGRGIATERVASPGEQGCVRGHSDPENGAKGAVRGAKGARTSWGLTEQQTACGYARCATGCQAPPVLQVSAAEWLCEACADAMQVAGGVA